MSNNLAITIPETVRCQCVVCGKATKTDNLNTVLCGFTVVGMCPECTRCYCWTDPVSQVAFQRTIVAPYAEHLGYLWDASVLPQQNDKYNVKFNVIEIDHKDNQHQYYTLNLMEHLLADVRQSAGSLQTDGIDAEHTGRMVQVFIDAVLNRMSLLMRYIKPIYPHIPDVNERAQARYKVAGIQMSRLPTETVKSLLQAGEFPVPGTADADTSTTVPTEHTVVPTERTTRQRGSTLTFSLLGIDDGSVVRFLYNQDITAAVSGDRQLTFDGKDMSIKDATCAAFTSAGRTPPSPMRPAHYWKYNDKQLDTIYNEKINQ